HPLEHDPDVAMGPADYRIICLDRDHVDYVYKYYPNVKKCYFLPLPGVLTAEKEPEPFEKREYDLLFTGSFYSLGKLENEISAYSPMIRKYTLELIEYMLDHREKTFETGLTELLGAMGEKDLDPLTFRKYASVTIIAMRYVRSYVKIEAIRYLMESDIRMHIFGGGWEEYANEGSGATVLHPPVNYLESVDLCQKARIALNVMPLFKDGCHDRIPTAMLNGAAVLTDHSRYLDETMGGELYFFDISKPWEISGIVKAILADDISIQKRTEKAYSLAREKLSVPAWAKNVKDILD
nr:hypothetical protein [Lachnospiraceae bacterium]